MAFEDDDIPDLFPGGPAPSGGQHPSAGGSSNRAAQVPSKRGVAPPSTSAQLEPSLSEEPSLLERARGEDDELEFDLVAATSTRSELILPFPPLTPSGVSGGAPDTFELELAPPPGRVPPAAAPRARAPESPAVRPSDRPAARPSDRPAARISDHPPAARSSQPPARSSPPPGRSSQPPGRSSQPPARGASPLSDRPPARASQPPAAFPAAQEIDAFDFLEGPGGQQPASPWSGGGSSGGLVDSSGGLLDWELDEMLGGPSSSSRAFDVVSEEREAAERARDEGPWPTGQPLDPADVSTTTEELLALSGYGSAPTGWGGAPSYWLRVLRARPQVRATLAVATKDLDEARSRLDRCLARLAESKRAELVDKDRFAPLYEQVALLEQQVTGSERAWQEASSEQASLFASLEARLEEARRVVAGEQTQLEARRLEIEQKEREAARARAALQRLSIERRNIQELAARRSSPDGEVPAELGRRYQEVVVAWENAEGRVRVTESELLGARREFTEAEERVRRARAAEQRLEGEKESHALAFEDEHSLRLGALESARNARILELARSARVMLELRGEVPVDRAVREELVRLEREASERVRRKVAVERALSSFDEGAFARGRTLSIVLVILLFLALVWLFVS